MSIKDELASVKLDVGSVRDGEVEAIIFSDENKRPVFKTVSIEEERPKNTIGYRVIVEKPSGVSKELYALRGIGELRITHEPNKAYQYIRADYVIPQ